MVWSAVLDTPYMGSSTTFSPRERMASILIARMMESTYWFMGSMHSISPMRTPSSKGTAGISSPSRAAMWRSMSWVTSSSASRPPRTKTLMPL